MRPIKFIEKLARRVFHCLESEVFLEYVTFKYYAIF